MQPIRRISGRCVPLDRPNIDTDQIIPSVWLKRVERTGFGEGLFAEWRVNPEFVLNQPVYAGASILVAGPNFGCGSSREHAAWALEDYGFRAVIAPSFADIFFNNSLKIGLVPVVLPADHVRFLVRCVEANPARHVIIDVAERTVTVPDVEFAVDFPLDEYHRHRLLEGLDEIGTTLRLDASILDYEQRRHPFMPRMNRTGFHTGS
jgi:3-isopropylmalate/(R)-2-methylmalate dehydratase small subunit